MVKCFVTSTWFSSKCKKVPEEMCLCQLHLWLSEMDRNIGCKLMLDFRKKYSLDHQNRGALESSLQWRVGLDCFWKAHAIRRNYEKMFQCFLAYLNLNQNERIWVGKCNVSQGSECCPDFLGLWQIGPNICSCYRGLSCVSCADHINSG